MTDETVYTPTADEWDTFVAGHPQGHLLQTPAWGAFKSRFGWSAGRVALQEKGTIIAGTSILYRALPFGLGTMAYLPKGPLAPADWWAEPVRMAPLWQAIHHAARQQGARWLKVEVPCEDRPDIKKTLQAAGFRPSPQTIQPPRTIMLDISGDEETILQRMKQKTRYNIRLSARKEVTVREGTTVDDIASFNKMMTITGERDTFGVHAPEYFTQAYHHFGSAGRAGLFLASYEGRDLAGVMVFALGKTTWYFYGASTDEERNRMPAYGVQWAAIQWARARGCTVYDLWGVPDADAATLEGGFTDRHDGLWGVYRFKRGWGGRLVRQMPAWDHVYHRPIYGLYQVALRIAGKDDAG